MQNKANTFFLFLSNTLYVCFLLDFGVATLSFVSASKIPFAAGIISSLSQSEMSINVVAELHQENPIS